MKLLFFNFSSSKKLSEGNRQTIDLLEILEQRGYQSVLITSSPLLLDIFRRHHWPARYFHKIPFIFSFPFILLWYRLRWKMKRIVCQTALDRFFTTIPARIIGMHVFWMGDDAPRRLFSHFATTIVSSFAAKQELTAKGFSEGHMVVLYPGVASHVTQWQDTIYTTIAERDHTNFYRHQFCVGSVAPLIKESGIEYFLRAVATVREVIPDIRCIIVGSGPERQRFQWLAEQLRIHKQTLFIGSQDLPARWVTHFNILIHPSIAGNTPWYILLEAMLQEKPIIATQLHGITEIIEPSKTGIVLEPANAEMLAEAILNLYHHPEWREEMGKRGKDRVEKLFTLDRMANEFEKLLP